MTKWLMMAALAGAAMSGAPASAATYYLSDCQAGASPACVPGKADNDGLSPGTPKQLWSQLPAKNGGDRILFAKGGAWTHAMMTVAIKTASAANPIVWDSYSPPWGGKAKPILMESGAGRYIFNFNDGGKNLADGGYIIRNLDLRGGGVMGVSTGADAGVFAYWGVNDLVMEHLEISGFKIGMHMPHNPATPGGFENRRITLKNSYLHDNSAASFLGGADGLVIEGNLLDRNGTRPTFDHDIYISWASHAQITRQHDHAHRPRRIGQVCGQRDCDARRHR